MEEQNKAITTLIQNSGGVWTEADRPELQKMALPVLQKMVTNMAKPGAGSTTPANQQELMDALLKGFKTQNGDQKKDVTNAQGGGTTVQTIDAATLQKLLSELPEEQRLALLPADEQLRIRNSRMEEKVMKDTLIEVLVANARCPFDKDFLATKPVPELQALVDMLGPVDDPEIATPSPGFGGNGQPVRMFKVAAGAPVAGVHNAAGGGGKKPGVGLLPIPPANPAEWNQGGVATKVS